MVRWSRLGGAAALAAGVFLATTAAHAEQPATSAQPNRASAPTAADIVRLKNGGLVRGTISELVPGASVTIITLTGEARKLAMAEVSYAGPAANDPGAASEPASPPAAAAPSDAPDDEEPRKYVTIEAGEARLRLVSDPPGLVFQRQSGKAFSGNHSATGYARLCAAPCDITLPAGTETIAVGSDTGRPYKIQSLRIPEGPSELRAYYQDNQGKRNIGWIIMGAGLVGGAALFAVAVKLEESPPKPMMLAAYGTAAVGIGVGLGFVLISDDARFEQVPGARPPQDASKKTSLVPAVHGTF